MVEDLNSGGCGIFALTFYRHIKKYKPNLLKNYKIIFIYWDEEDERYEKNSLFINKKRKKIYAPDHIILKYKNFTFDSNGKYEIRNGCQIHEISEDIENVLLKSINKAVGGWNDCFKRKKGIPVLEKNFNIDLSDVQTYSTWRWG